MIEQKKREKAIEALKHMEEVAYGWNLDGKVLGMPVEDFENICHSVATMLKEQEPRVMTFAEVKQHYNLPPVFTDDLDMQEDYYQDIRPLYFEFPNPTPYDVHWRRSNHVRTYLEEWENRYNITWRVWTSRPTDAQREATPWEKHG